MRSALQSQLRRLSADTVLRRFVGVAVIAALLDGLTKVIAVQTLGAGGWVHISDRLGFMLVWNEGGAGGVSMGPATALFNVLITVLALVLVATVVRQLAAIDARATWALGLVSGGALGNLVSIVSGRKGVADFIGMHLWGDITIVANVADLMLWSGALLLVPVFATLLTRVREQRATRTAAVAAVPLQNPM